MGGNGYSAAGQHAADSGHEEPWARLRKAVPGRWDVPVLCAAAAGITRPSDMLRAINAEHALNRAVLFAVLKRLAASGLLEPGPVPGAMPRETHYRVTPEGRSILGIALHGPPAGVSGWWTPPMRNDCDDAAAAAAAVDPARPSPARIWNYLQGGKDNFAADRAAADQATAAMPSLPAIARWVRAWQADVVGMLADMGVRQFLDIGAGLPTAGGVHEVAQAIAPESRVVYVDNDPLVLAHARALLTSAPGGSCAYLDADLRNPGRILDGARRTLDLARPTGILMVAVLHFLADADDPWAIVSQLLAGITGDAYLAISHFGSDLSPAEATAGQRAYNARSQVPVHPRTQGQVARFFAGMQMLGPGLVPPAQWPVAMEGECLEGEEGAGHGYVGLGRREGRAGGADASLQT